MLNSKKKDYIVKGYKFTKPLPPIGYNHEDEDAQLYFNQLMRGNINVDQITDTQGREVRIFLSSTFSDFKIERNLIIKKVLPEIESTCNSYGLDLKFCDMRWGVTDSAVNEHLVEKLCINEIEICRKNSIGPFFVLLIGNRYGYRPIPSELPSSEFEMLQQLIETSCPKEIEIFAKWFKKDENAQPPVHVLLPIKAHLPNYADYNDDVKRRESGNEWWSIEERIRRTLNKVSKIACDNGQMRRERRQQIIRSVTETELWTAMMNDESDIDKCELNRCLAYERQLTGLMEDLQSESALKYVDYVRIDDKYVCDNDCLSFLNEFKKKIRSSGLTRYRQFVVPWSSRGVNEDIVTHQNYIEKLCKSMAKDLREVITARMDTLEKFTNRFDKAKNYLQSEVIHHWLFSREKSRVFCGRTVHLQTVFDLIGKDSRFPVLVHGDSGVGKTAFLAKVACALQADLSRPTADGRTDSESTAGCFDPSLSPVIVIRFLGTSANSSTLQQFLFSICFQIQVAYKLRVQFRKMRSISSLQWLFNNLIMTVSRKYAHQYPLVILLDSIDQLFDERLQARTLNCSWIPTETPTGVHIIMSVATDISNARLFQSLIDRLRGSKDNFIKLSCFEVEEVHTIIETMQRSKGRRLTTGQMDIVKKTVSNNPQALFIKITVENALSWTSFLPDSEWCVVNTIDSAVQLIFTRLENRYGVILIGYTLGYMTLGLNGLSELELEDLLSLQDSVLNEIYQYHDPPMKAIIRLPSLLWARIHADLSAYIVKKRTDGKLTMSWYHRQMHQCALDRYVTKPGLGKQLHEDIARYFSMTSPCRRTCVLKNSKRTIEIKDADRLITTPPMTSKQQRKLHALSYHLIEAELSKKLAEDCVANLHYLLCYLQCFGIQELIVWLKLCSDNFPDNVSITIIKNCIVFIEPLLEIGPHHLPVQLLGQLQYLERIVPNLDQDQFVEPVSLLASLCNQCRCALVSSPCLVPSIACFPSSLGSIKLYKETIERVISVPWNPCLVVLVGQTKHEWLVRLFNSNDRVSLCSIICESRPCNVVVPTMSQNYIFVQDSRHVFMYDIDTGNLEAKRGLFINNKVMLNECIAVDGVGRWIAIGSQNRIAILEYKTSTADKSPLIQRYILTVREVDKTTSMCFVQVERHALLLTAHNYNSKTQKKFILKLWQFEQNNELWSLDLESLSSKYSDFVHLWAVPQNTEADGNHTGATLIVLPNGSCFSISNIFDSHSLKSLITLDSSKTNKDLLRSLASDGDTVTITTTSNNQTFIHNVNRQGVTTPITIPNHIHQKAITCAVVNSYSGSLLIGLRSGNVSCIKDGATMTWRGHRSTVDYLSSLIGEGNDVIKLMTFSAAEKVVKCWTKYGSPLQTEEKFSKTIFEDMNAFAYSRTSNFFVIVDANFSGVHCGTIKDIATDIRHIPIALPQKQDTDVEPESMLVLGMEIVFNDQGVLIFFDNRIQLFNITKSELISTLDISSNGADRQPRKYWYVVDTGSTLLLLTFDESSNYFHLEFRRLQSIGQSFSSKLFLAPVNMSHPQTQLDRIDLISTNRRKYLIVLWRNDQSTREIVLQDPSVSRIKDSFLCSSLNLKDPSQTLCLAPCCNLDESKKHSGRNVISKSSNQPIFSYAIPTLIPDIFPSDILSENIVLVGGLGEVLLWDLDSGLCRIPKVPNFHTWFKHSLVINTQSDSSENGSLQTDPKQRGRRSLSESNPKDFLKHPITALLLSHRSELVISGCASGCIIVWRWIATLSLCGNEPDPVTGFRNILPTKHSAQVNCLALSRDLRLLVSGGADMGLCLWDLNLCSCLHQINIHCNPMSLTICCPEPQEPVSQDSESHVLCHAVHIGQNRMMLFDLTGHSLDSR